MTASLHQDRTSRGARTDLARASAVRRAVLGLLLLATAGCSTRSELGFTSLMNEVPATQAAVVPPPGGPSIVAVLQRRYLNGISQEIALSTAAATPGQNAFYVSLINDLTAQSEADDVLAIRPLTQDRIQVEMEERLPGIDMRTSLVYAQNKYGPFGFATGRSAAGDLCLYAWQRIEPNQAAILTPGGIVSVRLRLCDADATVEQLLRPMYGYIVSAYFNSPGWNPYGAFPPPPAHLGQLDAPIYPLGPGLTAPATPVRPRRAILSRPAAPVSRPAPARAAEPRARFIDKDTVPETAFPERQERPAGYPVVPPPPER